MNIVLSPDPMLRQVCEPCRVEDKSIKKLAKQMAKAMYKNNGCGLAAPQVGVLKRFLDLDGEEWTIEGDGLLGRCLQHELDHLDGKTMFEVCDPMTRIEALRAYEVALANGAKPGETGPEQ